MRPVDTLNRAFAADPEAIHAILCNRVPCNRALAEDPTIVVGESVVAPDAFNVGVVGILNGILVDMGLPLVASQWSDETDAEGRRRLIGFCEVPKQPDPV